MPVCRSESFVSEGALVGYDDLGRKIVLPKVPERIVLLSANPIDVLFEMGAGDLIVGVVDNIALSYPETCRRYPVLLEKTPVGKRSAPNMEKIIELNPDLVFYFASSDSPEKYARILEERNLPCAALTTVEDLAFGLGQIQRIGALIGKEKEANIVASRLKADVDGLTADIVSGIGRRPLVFFWWGDGNRTYGRRSAIHELIERAGGINLTGEFDKRHMEISPEYVISADPDVVVISYWRENQKEERIKAFVRKPGFERIRAVRNNRVYAIEGHLFFAQIRYCQALRELSRCVHPELYDHH